MTTNRFLFRRLSALMGLVMALMFAGFISPPHCYPGCGGYEEAAPAVMPDGPYARSIDRVIPSRPGDLLVVLTNGLRVAIRESRASTVVSTQVLVGTGSIYEGDRMGGGLSHYLEHVVSGGATSKLTESQIKDRMQAIGGASNAYTGYDSTVYFINTTMEHYKEAVSLLLAYVGDCQFDETEYQREKRVIVEEFQMGDNDPSRQLWYLFMNTAYRIHPVRNPVIGQKEIFLEMGKADLVSHYRRWYAPENMIVSIVGNVDKDEALNAVIDLAGGFKRVAMAPYVLPVEPPQLASRRVEKGLPTARIGQAQLGFRTVALTDEDLYPLDVLAVIMGDGRTSRLYRTIRDEKGLVLSVGASSWTPAFTEGQFMISMDLAYDNLSKAIAAVLEEVAVVQEDLITEEEIGTAKKKVAADHVFGQEAVQSQAGQLASDWMATGDPYFSEDYVSRIQNVGREDLRRVARKYFQKERMTIAVIRPHDQAPVAEESEQAPSGSTGDVRKVILPNRMTLLMKRSAAAPVVALNLLLKGGQRFEPPDKPGLSYFTASLLTKGTEGRSKLEISRAIESVGGTIGSSSGQDLAGVSLFVLKEHFNIALDLLSDVVLHPSFPEEEIEKQRRETLLGIQRLDEHWATEIARLFKRHYYRKHPYRNDVIGSRGAVETFSSEDIRGFYDSIATPNNAVLAVFGAIDTEAVALMVQEAFADFQPRILEQPIIEMETENITEDETFGVFNEKTSAAIMVGYNGLPIGDEDGPVVDVLDAIISGIGYPSGWLHDALRGGDKSLVYYVHAYPAFGIDGGYFAVTAQTSPDNYEQVLKIIQDRMGLIQAGEVDAVTLGRAKGMCITAHEMGLETIRSQASYCAANEILGLGFDYDRKYPELIARVTSADVLRVARRLLSHRLIVTTKPKSE